MSAATEPVTLAELHDLPEVYDVLDRRWKQGATMWWRGNGVEGGGLYGFQLFSHLGPLRRVEAS
jgi:hypothetical protein